MKYFLITFLLISSVFFAIGQETTNYSRGNTSTQIIDNTVSCIVKDKDSTIWIGTNGGVSHYNGKYWQNFVKEDGLAGERVFFIQIDSKGYKWIGTNSGLSRFDGQTFQNYLPDLNLVSMAIDKEGNKWIINQEGSLYKLDINGSSTVLTDNVLYQKFIRSIAIDSKGIKWMIANGPLDGVLIKYNDTTWTSYSGFPYTHGLVIDKLDNKWLNANNSILKFADSTWTLFNSDNSILSNLVHKIFIDDKNNKWFTYQGGISKFDDKNWTMVAKDTGVYQFCTDILLDKSEIKWIGGINGTSEKIGSTWKSYVKTNGLVNDRVTSVAIDKEGLIWFGTYGGVSVYNGTSWHYYTTDDGLISNLVNTVAIDEKGNKWFGTEEGVSKFDGKKWTSYTTIDGLNHNMVLSFAIDKMGNKWFGSYNGVAKFNDTTWTLYNESNSSLNGRVVYILIDEYNNKWFSGINGAVKFDDQSWTRYSGATGSLAYYVGCSAIDIMGTKWFAKKFDNLVTFDGSIWAPFSKKTGKQYTDINSITIDAYDNKWLATSYNGVYKYDGVTFTQYLSNFTTSNFANAIAIDANGVKWIGTNFGVIKLSDGGPGPLDLKMRQIGAVFYDKNNNGLKDADETTIAKQIIKVDNNFVSTKNDGLFHVSLSNGVHTFKYRPDQNWKSTTDSSITINVNSSVKDTLYFGAVPLKDIHSASVNITGSATRANFSSNYWISYTNEGALPESGKLSFQLDEKCILSNAIPQADSVVGSTYFWKFSKLLPNECRQISIISQMPGVKNLGDSLVSRSSIYFNNIQNPSSSDIFKQRLTGSYDPNDKHVHPSIGKQNYVLPGKEITFTIRFQNTGTDTAFNVNIRDTIDLNLDLQTLHIIGSSHPVTIDLKGKNQVNFQFINILLPDSNVNETGSNGYVKYALKPKSNLPENTLIKNKAHIYFDYNPAITTNETQNTFVSSLPTTITGLYDYKSPMGIILYPNPSRDRVTLSFPSVNIYEINLCEMDGSLVQKWNVNGNEMDLPLDNFHSGMYLIIIQNKEGERFFTKLIRN